MSLEAIAAAAVAILAKKFGENLPDKTGNLYQAIKNKFAGDAYATQTLSRFEERPDANGRKSTLHEILTEKMQEDSDFAVLVQGLLKDASDLTNVFAIGERSVSVGGSLRNSIVTTGDQIAQNATWTSSSSGVVKVFLSSTWFDLRPEREVVKTVLHNLRETKFIGMEYFGSRDESTHQASVDEVDGSDLYVGIFAGRYGSGITEREYRRALEKALPCLIYIKDEASISPEWRETDPDKSARLARLKEDLHRHTVSGFKGGAELAAKVTADVHRWLFDHYVPKRLQKAVEKGVPTKEDQAFISNIKDLSFLKDELLKGLQSAGYVLALGEQSVAIGGDVTGSSITTGNS